MSEQQGPGAEVSALLDSGAEADEAAAAGVPADPGLAAERDRLAQRADACAATPDPAPSRTARAS